MSAMSTVQRAKDVDAGRLRFGAPKALGSGQKMIDVQTEAGRPLLVQTPPLRCPFGIRASNLDGVDKSTMDLECYDVGEDADRSLFDMLKTLDARVLDEALAHGWCAGAKDAEELAARYATSYRFGKDPKYPPMCKVNVPKKAGRIACQAFDAVAKKELDLSKTDISRARVTAILQCSGVWVSPSGDRFGTSWRVAQLKVEGGAPAGDAAGETYAFLES
jgi:hypothetical protein